MAEAPPPNWSDDDDDEPRPRGVAETEPVDSADGETGDVPGVPSPVAGAIVPARPAWEPSPFPGEAETVPRIVRTQSPVSAVAVGSAAGSSFAIPSASSPVSTGVEVGLPPSVAQSGAPHIAAEDSPIPAAAPFHIGVAGPVGSGKSYWFQSLAYRLQNPGRYGVLTRYLKRGGVSLWRQTRRRGNLGDSDENKGEWLDLPTFNSPYESWQRLKGTRVDEFYRYTMVLKYNVGWLGLRETAMKLTFIDCSGELFVTPPGRDPLVDAAWGAFEKAQLMIFCLPLWAVFPNGSEMQKSDWVLREQALIGFEAILKNYQRLRQDQETAGRKPPKTRIVLALTQADDRRNALETLAQNWVHDYIDNDGANLRRLARPSGPTKYLAAARRISDYVSNEFRQITDDSVKKTLARLDTAGMKPWLIPVTAIEGSLLPPPDDGTGAVPWRAAAVVPSGTPKPAHVELPLLFALCEAHNALM
jgi:hypothetical protein